jgi:hypothetical protein
MIEVKSAEQVADIINRKIAMLLLEQLPTPSCNLKKQQNEWKKEQVKKILIEKLSK